MKAEVMITLGSATISKAKEEENHAQAKACRNEPIQKSKIKLERAQGGCLGTKSRRRTW